jgi:hypothetical protein
MFVIGSPLFPRAEIDLGGTAPFVIDAPAASAQSPYITAAALDGRDLSATWISGTALHPGGLLHLDMSSTAATWGDESAAHPPSVSQSGLSPFGCDQATGPGTDVPEFSSGPLALAAAALLLGLAGYRRRTVSRSAR